MEIASRHNLYVIEDVAEAPGALYKGRQLGGIGHIACFSFFSNKIITTGEGGMIALDDASLKDRIEELRDHGMSKEKRYKHTHLGFNYRMTNMQAAVGLAQLEQLPKILALREQQQRKYESCLNHPEYLSFHPRFAACQPVHWMMTILLKRENIRDALVDYLRTKGIDSRQMIYPVHFARPYQRRYRGGSFPNAERISLNCLHLPSATGLKTEEIEYISACVMAFLRTRV